MALSKEGWVLKINVDKSHKEMLDVDLGTVGDRFIPKDINNCKEIIAPKILQIKKVRDVGHSKIDSNKGTGKSIFRVTLTDGVSTINAINLVPLPGISGKTLPGVKLKISRNVPVVGGFLLLSCENSVVLGGRVDKLIENIEKNQNICKKTLGKEGEGPPQFKPFRSTVNSSSDKTDEGSYKKDLNDQVRDLSLSSQPANESDNHQKKRSTKQNVHPKSKKNNSNLSLPNFSQQKHKPNSGFNSDDRSRSNESYNKNLTDGRRGNSSLHHGDSSRGKAENSSRRKDNNNQRQERQDKYDSSYSYHRNQDSSNRDLEDSNSYKNEGSKSYRGRQSGKQDSYHGNQQESYRRNQQDSYRGNQQDSYRGSQQDSYRGNQQDSCRGNQQDSYHRNQQDSYRGGQNYFYRGQQNYSYRGKQNDSYRGKQNNSYRGKEKDSYPGRHQQNTYNLEHDYYQTPSYHGYNNPQYNDSGFHDHYQQRTPYNYQAYHNEYQHPNTSRGYSSNAGGDHHQGGNSNRSYRRGNHSY